VLTRAEDQRRNARAKQHGRTSAYWRRLRVQALERDGYTCQGCGRQATSVHIRPDPPPLLTRHAVRCEDALGHR
jgi:5-methylcytosine-specific restriction endonuclease McrA